MIAVQLVVVDVVARVAAVVASVVAAVAVDPVGPDAGVVVSAAVVVELLSRCCCFLRGIDAVHSSRQRCRHSLPRRVGNPLSPTTNGTGDVTFSML